MDDPTVVAGLVVAEDVLFFQQGNAGLGMAALQFQECGRTDDAAAHHDEVEWALRFHVLLLSRRRR